MAMLNCSIIWEIQSSRPNTNRQIAQLNLGVNKANLAVCKSEQNKRAEKTKKRQWMRLMDLK